MMTEQSQPCCVPWFLQDFCRTVHARPLGQGVPKVWHDRARCCICLQRKPSPVVVAGFCQEPAGQQSAGRSQSREGHGVTRLVVSTERALSSSELLAGRARVGLTFLLEHPPVPSARHVSEWTSFPHAVEGSLGRVESAGRSIIEHYPCAHAHAGACARACAILTSGIWAPTSSLGISAQSAR